MKCYSNQRSFNCGTTRSIVPGRTPERADYVRASLALLEVLLELLMFDKFPVQTLGFNQVTVLSSLENKKSHMEDSNSYSGNSGVNVRSYVSGNTYYQPGL